MALFDKSAITGRAGGFMDDAGEFRQSLTHLFTYSLRSYNPPALVESGRSHEGAVSLPHNWSSVARRNLWQIR